MLAIDVIRNVHCLFQISECSCLRNESDPIRTAYQISEYLHQNRQSITALRVKACADVFKLIIHERLLPSLNALDSFEIDIKHSGNRMNQQELEWLFSLPRISIVYRAPFATRLCMESPIDNSRIRPIKNITAQDWKIAGPMPSLYATLSKASNIQSLHLDQSPPFDCITLPNSARVKKLVVNSFDSSSILRSLSLVNSLEFFPRLEFGKLPMKAVFIPMFHTQVQMQSQLRRLWLTECEYPNRNQIVTIQRTLRYSQFLPREIILEVPVQSQSGEPILSCGEVSVSGRFSDAPLEIRQMIIRRNNSAWQHKLQSNERDILNAFIQASSSNPNVDSIETLCTYDSKRRSLLTSILMEVSCEKPVPHDTVDSVTLASHSCDLHESSPLNKLWCYMPPCSVCLKDLGRSWLECRICHRRVCEDIDDSYFCCRVRVSR